MSSTTPLRVPTVSGYQLGRDAESPTACRSSVTCTRLGVCTADRFSAPFTQCRTGTGATKASAQIHRASVSRPDQAGCHYATGASMTHLGYAKPVVGLTVSCISLSSSTAAVHPSQGSHAPQGGDHHARPTNGHPCTTTARTLSPNASRQSSTVEANPCRCHGKLNSTAVCL